MTDRQYPRTHSQCDRERSIRSILIPSLESLNLCKSPDPESLVLLGARKGDELASGATSSSVLLFFPVKKKSARENCFFSFFGFFHGQKVFFTHTFFCFFHAHFFFHGHNFCIFSRVEYFVSRGVFFFTQVGVFFYGH